MGTAVAPPPAPFALTIPVVGASFADGVALSAAGLDRAHQRPTGAEHHDQQRARGIDEPATPTTS